MHLARLQTPDADWREARAHLSTIARDVVELSCALAPDDLAGRAGVLAGLMTGRYGYLGDTEQYDDLDNANLIRVIQRRRGLPVALGILWLHAARAAGWPARGINFPGHFLFALEGERKEGRVLVVLDVFRGGVTLDRDDLRRMLRAVNSPDLEPGPRLLAAMSSRDVLLRLQANIKSRLILIGDVQAALACVNDTLRLAPEEPMLWREAGQLYQRLDQVEGALRCYGRSLQLAPRGEAAARTRAAMAELRGRLH